MITIVRGTEKANNNLFTGATLQVNGVATSYTVPYNGVLSGRVQLGTGPAALAYLERLQIEVRITNIETGDQCLMPPYVMDVPDNEDEIMLVIQPFPVLENDVVAIKVWSNDSSDTSVGSSVEMLMIGYPT